MKKAYATLLTLLVSVVLWAQEKTDIDVKIGDGDGGGSNWYAQPWVWIAGAALFILLLIALTSGGRRRRTTDGDVTVTKTTVRRDPSV